MRIGDEVFVHGYVDEIRYDDAKRVNAVIIRNDGGYFGTVPSEVYQDHRRVTKEEVGAMALDALMETMEKRLMEGGRDDTE